MQKWPRVYHAPDVYCLQNVRAESLLDFIFLYERMKGK